MNLDNLKPAWRKFQLMNSMRSIDQEEILLIIERMDGLTVNRTQRVLINMILFTVFTFCCQGG